VLEADHRDEDLLAAARAGSREAIEALLGRYQQRVFAFGLHMCGDPEDAKDVLQETMLAAARGVKQFRGGSSLSTWLFSIARSFCIKKRRQSKFAPLEEVPLESVVSDLPADAPGPDDVAARQEVKSAIAAALAELAPDLREVIILRDVEGFTGPEVGEITGDSVDAVKSRLHRARAAVCARLATTLGDTLPPRGRDCPDVLAAFSKKLEGDLDPKVCADLERHIEACPGCRGICDSLKRTLAVCAGVATGPVPEDVRRSVRTALHDVLVSAP
jgi:RNA polymerase sigma-70 factor (ECF subfamily)